MIGESVITYKLYKEILLVEAVGEYKDYLEGLVGLNSRLAYNLLEALDFSSNEIRQILYFASLMVI